MSLKQHQTSIPARVMRGESLHFFLLMRILGFFSRFPVSWQVLSCLVQIASVRRSLFNNAERAKFLSHLVDGVKRILENPQVSVRVGIASSSSQFIPKNPFNVPTWTLGKGENGAALSCFSLFPPFPHRGTFRVDIRKNSSVGRVFKDWNHPWKCPKTSKCGNSRVV